MPQSEFHRSTGSVRLFIVSVTVTPSKKSIRAEMEIGAATVTESATVPLERFPPAFCSLFSSFHVVKFIKDKSVS